MYVEKAASDLHQEMTWGLIRLLEGKGWKVTAAALEGYSRPKQRNGHVPDVQAENPEGLVCLGEVKTSDDISNEHSYSQYKAFTGWNIQGNRCPFFLFVPKGSRSEAVEAIRTAGVAASDSVHIFEYG